MSSGGGDVVIIGPYPPPIGGVSEHVRRLALVLQKRHVVRVIDPYRSDPVEAPVPVVGCGRSLVQKARVLVVELRRRSIGFVHIHVSSMGRFLAVAPLVLLLVPRDAVSLLTIHSGAFAATVEQAGAVRRYLFRWVLSRIDRVVVVNKIMAEALTALGVSRERVVLLPAFLPEEGAGRIPEEIAAASQGRRLIVSSGYGERHYGFDDAIEAVARLTDGRQDVCLALCLYHSYDADYVEHLRERAESLGAVVLVKDMTPQDFNAVLRRASLYLRCTTRDGDAVAVREALAWGVPVIATDCVPRPEGVGTYRHGDTGALYRAAGRVLAEAPAPAQGSSLAGLTSADRFLQLFEVGAVS